MALLPTGSDKLLEIRTSDIDLVIKSKNIQTAVAVRAAEQSSSVAITTFGLERVNVGIQNIDLNFENSGKYSAQTINVTPLFFEQTDYELVVNSRNGKGLYFWNENYLIREKIGSVIEGNNTLITGIINFGNSVGYTDLEITADDRKVLTEWMGQKRKNAGKREEKTVMNEQTYMYSGLGERLKKEWKIYIAALIFIVIADSIGQIKIPLGPGTLILFPIFYSIILGVLAGPQVLKIFKKPEVKAASKLVIVCI